VRFCLPTEESDNGIYAGLPGFVNVFHGEAKQKEGNTQIELADGISLSSITDATGNIEVHVASGNIGISGIPLPPDGRNILAGKITNVIAEKNATKLVIDAGVSFTALIAPQDYRESGLETGSTVYLIIKKTAVQIYQPGSHS
jgi:molybdopterin-binding protein